MTQNPRLRFAVQLQVRVLRLLVLDRFCIAYVLHKRSRNFNNTHWLSHDCSIRSVVLICFISMLGPHRVSCSMSFCPRMVLYLGALWNILDTSKICISPQLVFRMVNAACLSLHNLFVREKARNQGFLVNTIDECV